MNKKEVKIKLQSLHEKIINIRVSINKNLKMTKKITETKKRLHKKKN